MLFFLARRIGVMLVTAFCLTFVVFYLTNIPAKLETLAKTQAGSRISDAEVASWLDRNGYNQPMLVRYGEWLGVARGWTHAADDGAQSGRCYILSGTTEPGAAPARCGLIQGYWGNSTRFRAPVSEVIGARLGATGMLMLWVLIVMVPMALVVGVLAGMREGSRTDRTLSTFAIASTATPEYVSGVVFIALLASSTVGLSPLLVSWGWIEGPVLFQGNARSALDNITFWNFALPVMTVALYGMGYVARITRASMTEVMTQQYVRTARLKGVSFPNIVLRHALRNALIAPFTVIMLQIPWLLNGVVIVEVLFSYPGFGWTLFEAAANNDIELLLAASVVAVLVVLITQLISDIGYVYLNPRIRVT
ncbi:Dipeptide transport system permease protein DppB [Roseibaca ekhonensis]|uniref:Dipeptide transport system permease protein DppB n=1 Tax=Roseinatronobacter ekhonensis TaxID=254356 RepID=A0A3B0M9J5_9RHOB|nr:ABC transporter permease [Roseibaca ekhonensis]SUZ32050.1 Dipeptide transport system permease protein DppB [Roseibaca ekhonensis]